MGPLNPKGAAPATTFTPSNPGDWQTPPSDVAEALNQLAAKPQAQAQADTTAYVPGVPGDWSPAPTQVSTALDQLAASVELLATEPYTPTVPGNWSPAPTQVGPALDQLAARPSGGGGGVVNTLIFRPGGTAGGNVYIDEATLATATQALNGEPYTIVFDMTISGGYTLTTAGVLNLAPLGYWTDAGLGSTVFFENDTQIQNTPVEFSGSLSLRFDQNSTAFPNGVNNIILVKDEVVLRNTSSSSTAFLVDGDVILGDAVTIRGNTNSNQFVFGNATVRAQGAARIQSGVDTSTSTIVVTSPGVYVDSSLYSAVSIVGEFFDSDNAGTGSLSASNSNGALVSSGNQLFQSNGSAWVAVGTGSVDASAVNYSPGTPGDWTSPPTQVGPALDELAAGTAATERYSPGTPGNWQSPPAHVGPALDELAQSIASLPAPDAATTPYTPGVPGNWQSPPAQVSAALDELAAKPLTAQGVSYSPSAPANWPTVPSQVAQALDEITSLVTLPTPTTPVGSVLQFGITQPWHNPDAMAIDANGKLWVANLNTANTQPCSIYQVDPVTLTILQSVLLTSHAPYGNSVIHIRSLTIGTVSGTPYLFASALDSYGVFVIDMSIGQVVGTLQLTSGDQAIDCDLDPFGNVWVNSNDNANGNSTIYIFLHQNIPSFNQSPLTTSGVGVHLEDLTFDAPSGYFWAGSGNSGTNTLYRVGQTGGNLPATINGSYTGSDTLWGAHGAFGSIWSGGTTGIYRFDPNTFPSAPVTVTPPEGAGLFTEMTHDSFFVYVCNTANNTPSIVVVNQAVNSAVGPYINGTSINQPYAPVFDASHNILWICNSLGETDGNGSIVKFDRGNSNAQSSFRGPASLTYEPVNQSGVELLTATPGSTSNSPTAVLDITKLVSLLQNTTGGAAFFHLPDGTDGLTKEIVGGVNGQNATNIIIVTMTNNLGNDVMDFINNQSARLVWLTAAGGWVATSVTANVNTLWD